MQPAPSGDYRSSQQSSVGQLLPQPYVGAEQLLGLSCVVRDQLDTICPQAVQYGVGTAKGHVGDEQEWPGQLWCAAVVCSGRRTGQNWSKGNAL